MAQAICRSCSAPIRWTITEKGNRIPIDPAPAADGNLVLLGSGPVDLAVSFDATRHAGRVRFQNHFASCPHAGAHRKSR